MIQREYIRTIAERMEEPRNFIQVLYGPRQVGKTTMVEQYLSTTPHNHLFVTADDTVQAEGSWIREQWDKARMLQKQNESADFILVIDEVQKISNWSETIKTEWDADTRENIPIKVILLGSSSLLIQQGLTESLAGRFESIFIPHWTYPEMKNAFGWSLDKYLWFGGYPGSEKLTDNETRWKRYIKSSLIETSISKDILMLTRVNKPALLHKLFNIGCSYSAQILSLTKIQGDLMEKGNLTTLSDYLALLDAAGLLCGLEKYAGDIIRKRASKPKFQVYNNALLSSQSEFTFDEIINKGKEWGRIVESAVGSHLLNKAREGYFDLYYWNENSREVDYVLQKGSKVIAIEVKSGKDSINEGMALFNAKFHPHRLYTVGTNGIPLETFLTANPEDLF
ncbi:MAG: AAA family ATPase [Bacteroidales bacterium]|nr:AAA family ATPase [Bacteroidales bacterium]